MSEQTIFTCDRCGKVIPGYDPEKGAEFPRGYAEIHACQECAAACKAFEDQLNTELAVRREAFMRNGKCSA